MTMFNWRLLIILIAISVPGVLVSTPNLIRSLENTILTRLPPGQKVPSRRLLIIASSLQTLVLVAISAGVGTYLAPRAGLSAPFFEALARGEPLWPAIQPQVVPTLTFGGLGALIFLAAYYLIARPRLDSETVRTMEGLRMGLGIWSRLLYGGVVEEILVRWGLMTSLVWLGATLAGGLTPVVLGAAILVSGTLFGLGHLPSYLAAGCKKTPLFVGLMIGLNVWAAVIFSWLYWQGGLLGAMGAHMLFHLVWYPFDIYFVNQGRKSPLPETGL
jgi:hypothetical protein